MASSLSLPPTGDRRPVWHSPLFWLVLWAVAGFVGRVLISRAVMWDQAEQLIWTQDLAWGYGPQPPLYTWLQWGVNQWLGPTALSLALVKFSLMLLTFGFMALAARQLMPAPTAWLAALGLWWLPGFEWQVLRDLTHTVLLTCLVTASWWLLLRQVRRPTPGGFALLGLAMGLGMLSKYSYLLVACAMLGAALSLPVPRRALLSGGWWLAPLIGLLVVAPHGLWVLTHWQEASTATLHKMHDGDPAVGLPRIWLGLWDMLRFSLLAVLPWALMSVWAFGWRAWRSASPPPAAADVAAPDWAAPLWRRYFALLFAALTAMVLLARVVNFEGRWLHPLLCVAPIAAFTLRPWLGRVARGVRRSARAVLVMAVLLSAVVLLDCWVDARLRSSSDRFNWNLDGIAAALRAGGYDGRAPMIANHHVSAGNLRIAFPQARVVVCDYMRVDTADCVREAAAEAYAAGNGWLQVAIERPAPQLWWGAPTTPDTWGDATVRTLGVPYRWSRPGMEPLLIEYRWHAPVR